MADTKAGSVSQPLKQYYVAVGTLEAKLATLLDLLRAFQAASPLSAVVCCGSRDSLDLVCSAVAGLDSARLWCLHADMSERDIDGTVQRFKAACTDPGSITAEGNIRPSQDPSPHPPLAAQRPSVQHQQQPSRMASGEEAQGDQSECTPGVEILATTDVCLKVVSRELLPFNPTLLIGYDLPTRKDVYQRRVTAVLGSRASAAGRSRILVHFAVAGQLEEFRAVEGFAERSIEGMPVHVTDILSGGGQQHEPGR